MRVTFSSSHRRMAYGYFKKIPMLMCEIKLNHLLLKNPELINSPNRNIIYPFIQEYAFFSAPASAFPQLQPFEHKLKYNYKLILVQIKHESFQKFFL